MDINIESVFNLNFTSILTIIFVIAKLCKIINWSWWLVFSPSLISIAVALLIIIISIIIVIINDFI